MNKTCRDDEIIYFSIFDTGIGAGGVVANALGLLEVWLPFAGEDKTSIENQIAKKYPTASKESRLTQNASVLLSRYFSGEPVHFDLPICSGLFTVFQMSAYAAVSKIPYGEVRSYSQIAVQIGHPKAARGVGVAMGRNPIPVVIPCHRVVGKNGAMTGYSAPGGIDSKRWLLDMERGESSK